MAQATRVIRLTEKEFESGVPCSGEQLKIVLQEIYGSMTDCIWYTADVDAYQDLPLPLKRGEQIPVQVGNTEDLIAVVEQVEQFVSGIFLAVPRDRLPVQWTRSFFTEDDPYAEMDEAIIEIRTFDTSYFEIYAATSNLLQELSLTFNVPIEVANVQASSSLPKTNSWLELKTIWNQAQSQNKQVTVNINVLYPPDDSQQPAGLDVHYTIDEEAFTRTFRGIPEGYDAIRRPER